MAVGRGSILRWLAHRGRQGDAIGRPETVTLLLAFVEDVVVADENERQRHLDTKAGTLAGFVAVALSLEAGLGASVLLHDRLTCAPKILFEVFFAAAVVTLGLAALFAVLGVLVPQTYLGVDEAQIDDLCNEPTMSASTPELRERLLATLVEITLEGRRRNNKKAKWLKAAALSLAAAVSAIAAQGLTLLFA